MSKPTDNRPAALSAKVELRQLALDHVGADKAHVLDAFCGDGVLHDRVWHQAASYVGIDKRLCWPPRARRFCGDNRRILRAIDLQPFNVFDLDAHGSPWHAAVIVADRRGWAKGEAGAIVFTSGHQPRWAHTDEGMRALLGRETSSYRFPFADQLETWCLRAWLKRAQVEAVEMYQAHSGGKQFKTHMNYATITFRGRGLPARNTDMTPPYEHRPDRRARKLARNAVRNAVRRGEMASGPCAREAAGGCSGKLEAHHVAGYDEEHWLDVVWYCERHHELVHKKL